MATYQIYDQDTQRGPYQLSQISAMWNQGLLTANAQYWDDPAQEWKSVAELVTPLQPRFSPTQTSSQPFWLILISALMLGMLGVHRFIVGKWKSALLQLLTVGGLGIWALIDIITILRGRFTDAKGLVISNVGKAASWALTVIFLGFLMWFANHQTKHSPWKEATSTAEATSMPDTDDTNATTVTIQQKAFCDGVDGFISQYQSAQNDLRKSALRASRKRKIEDLVPNLQFNGWYGRLDEMSTTSKGNAHLVITLNNQPIKIENYNNELSDALDGTLIPMNSNLFSKVADLKTGMIIKVTGCFLADDQDFIKEGSLTEEGSMTEPEFIVKFSQIDHVSSAVNSASTSQSTNNAPNNRNQIETDATDTQSSPHMSPTPIEKRAEDGNTASPNLPTLLGSIGKLAEAEQRVEMTKTPEQRQAELEAAQAATTSLQEDGKALASAGNNGVPSNLPATLGSFGKLAEAEQRVEMTKTPEQRQAELERTQAAMQTLQQSAEALEAINKKEDEQRATDSAAAQGHVSPRAVPQSFPTPIVQPSPTPVAQSSPTPLPQKLPTSSAQGSLAPMVAVLDDVQVGATVSNTSVGVGDSLTYTITVNGASDVSVPQTIEVEGLRITYEGPTQKTQISFGSGLGGGSPIQRSVIHTYTIVPQRTGEFVIPSQQIVVAGRNYTLGPVKMKVGGVPRASKRSRSGSPFDDPFFQNPFFNYTQPTPSTQSSASSSNEITAGQLGSFIAQNLRLSNERDIAGLLAKRSEREDYFDQGIVDQDFVRSDMGKYFQRWPYGGESLTGAIRVKPGNSPNSVIASFRTHFRVENADGVFIEGDNDNTVIVQAESGSMKIVSEKSKVTNRRKGRVPVPNGEPESPEQ